MSLHVLKNKHNKNYILHDLNYLDAEGMTGDKLQQTVLEVDRRERGFDQGRERNYAAIQRHYDEEQKAGENWRQFPGNFVLTHHNNIYVVKPNGKGNSKSFFVRFFETLHIT